MYFIITHSSNFEDFLYINRMLYKCTKQGIFIVIYYCELKLKIGKSPIKQLKIDIQLKKYFFVV